MKSALMLAACLAIMLGLAMLSGCTAGKYLECIARDATSRPCN